MKRLRIIAGPNGSGKSTIINALKIKKPKRMLGLDGEERDASTRGVWTRLKIHLDFTSLP